MAFPVPPVEVEGVPGGMNVISLCYHDVVADGCLESSGFPGASAGSYKLDATQMARHLAALQDRRPDGVSSVQDVIDGNASRAPLLLTFDDGGVGAATATADLLERYGWIGHFLITASRVGTPGFLDRGQIRELHQRGHVIGSHSWSHPERISRCDDAALHEEWQRSGALLGDIIGAPTMIGSVPGGFYSARVATAAAAAGIHVLFTSEPRKRTWRVGECLVLGRYAIFRRTSAEEAAALASARTTPAQLRQAVFWRTKKVAKTIGGRFWLSARERWWERR
jgi:hypothetical protein